MEENNISNLTSQQIEQVNNQLQATMMSAKLFGDEDLVTRCSRAILAFNSNILDHNPTFEEMLNELAHNTGNEEDKPKIVEKTPADFGNVMTSLFNAFAQANSNGLEKVNENMESFPNLISNISTENKEMEETKE